MKKIFLFPGQGSQYIGMGQKMLDYIPAKNLLNRANEIVDIDLEKLMFEGSESDLRKTENTQPALFVASMMAFEYLKEKNCSFDFVAGHSLGEYSALCAASFFSFEDALELVKLRGELMSKAGEVSPGTMSAILGLAVDKVEQIVNQAKDNGDIVVANYNTPSQIVISGETKAIEVAQELAIDAGAKRVVPLPVSGPFHSPLMSKASKPLEEALNNTRIFDIKTPVICNVDGLLEQDAFKIREKLLKQMVSPVRWVASVEEMIKLGVTQGYEIGSGKVLRGLIRCISREINVDVIESVLECEQLLGEM